jgi:hypothetical protein
MGLFLDTVLTLLLLRCRRMRALLWILRAGVSKAILGSLLLNLLIQATP